MKNLTAPRGWFRAGSHPKQYDMGLDPSVCCNEMATALVRSCSNTSDGFGTLMQSCKTGAFADTRVRFSAMTRTQGVDEWAGLWLRIDGPIQGESLNFDNMQDRALRGTSGWQRHSVTLDVPKETTKLAFGVLLSGQGSVWIADVHMETVGLDVPTTNLKLDEPNIPEAPVNLAFTDKPGHH
ncbi:MAG: AraC family transcriptional regulator, partial [Planctomycetes bacterium]|nr:AraC family transcriptional regulator [Planctomycetota bacterium]